MTDRPSFISLRTIIGWPAPTKQNTGKAHGSALGDDEVAATKEVLGFDPKQTFEVADDVIAHTRKLRRARREPRSRSGRRRSTPGRRPIPTPRRCTSGWSNDELSPGWEDALPSWDADPKGVATRAASGKVLGALADKLPELWGGSADLAESNNTTMEGEPSFLPTDRQSKMFPGNPYGRTLHFGIREHAMGSIMNGIKVHGGTRPYGGTFLQFSDYMRPAVRLAALMRLPGHLRLDPRLDRPRRGRPDPPADRAPRRTALHPRTGRGPAGRRQRDGRRLGGDPGEHRPAGRSLPQPAGAADRAARHGRLRRHQQRRQGCVRPSRTPRTARRT